MSVGGVFLLLLVLVVLIVGGTLLAALVMKLRGRQLHPREDKIASAGARPSPDEPRPQHVRVETEQRTRFVRQR